MATHIKSHACWLLTLPFFWECQNSSEIWRHPDLLGLKPNYLDILRAKTVSSDSLQAYYSGLKITHDNYDSHHKPGRIFNNYETDITSEHKRHKVSVPAVTST